MEEKSSIDLLAICVECREIRIGETGGKRKTGEVWVGKEHPVYEGLFNLYHGQDRLTHCYCPRCLEKYLGDNRL